MGRAYFEPQIQGKSTIISQSYSMLINMNMHRFAKIQTLPNAVDLL